MRSLQTTPQHKPEHNAKTKYQLQRLLPSQGMAILTYAGS